MFFNATRKQADNGSTRAPSLPNTIMAENPYSPPQDAPFEDPRPVKLRKFSWLVVVLAGAITVPIAFVSSVAGAFYLLNWLGVSPASFGILPGFAGVLGALVATVVVLLLAARMTTHREGQHLR